MKNDTFRLKESREVLVVALAFAVFLLLSFLANYGVISRLLRGESLDIGWAVIADVTLLYLSLYLSAMMPGIVVDKNAGTVSFPNLAYRNLFRRTVRLQDVREFRDETDSNQVSEDYEFTDFVRYSMYGSNAKQWIESKRAASMLGNTLRALLGLENNYKMFFFGDFGSASLILHGEGNYKKLRYAIDDAMGDLEKKGR